MAELRPGGPSRDPANGSSVPAGYYWARQRLFAGFKFARKMTERFDRKWDLTRRLYDLGLDKPAIWELYRLIDWLMRLPEALEKDFKQRMFDYERSKAMPYVTSIERMAMKEGLEEGWQKGQLEGQVTSLQVAIVEVL